MAEWSFDDLPQAPQQNKEWSFDDLPKAPQSNDSPSFLQSMAADVGNMVDSWIGRKTDSAYDDGNATPQPDDSDLQAAPQSALNQDATTFRNNVKSGVANWAGDVAKDVANNYNDVAAYDYAEQGYPQDDRTQEQIAADQSANAWKLYQDAVANPAGKIAVTPGVPGTARAVAGALYTPELLADMRGSFERNTSGDGESGNDSGYLGAAAMTAKETLIDPLINPVKEAVTDPGQFEQSIVNDPANLWNKVFLPGTLAKGAYDKASGKISSAADKAMKDLEDSLPTAPDAAGFSDERPSFNGDAAVDEGFSRYDGKRMENGRNGCVEAVGDIGAQYSPFLARESEAGQVNVSGLVNDAHKDGVPVIGFDESKLQKGDVIVFGDEDHVLISDGKGGYYGNSSNADGPDAGGHVIHGNDIYSLGDDLQPTKIIKTGGGEYSPAPTRERPADAFSDDFGGIDTSEDGTVKDAFGRDEQPAEENPMRQDIEDIADRTFGDKPENDMAADVKQIVDDSLPPVDNTAARNDLEGYINDLKEQRQQAIDDTVDMYKKNPGGSGVDAAPTFDDMGDRSGTAAVSNNPQWYQNAWADLGRKPKKSEYQDIALRELRNQPEFASLEKDIADAEKRLADGKQAEAEGRPAQYSGKRISDDETLESTDTPETITKQAIIDRARDLFGAIRTGRMRNGSGHRAGNVLGFYSPDTDVVRSRDWGDIETITHEIGHSIDEHMHLTSDNRFDSEFRQIVENRFGKGAYKPKEIRGEGVAEFFHDYMFKGDAVAKKNFPAFFDDFQKRMAADPKMATKIDEMRDMCERWNGQAAEARGRAAVSYADERKPSPMQRLKDTYHSFIEGWVDDKDAIQRAQESFNRLTGEVADTAHDVYKQSRLALNSAMARAQLMVEDGKSDLTRESLNKVYGKIAGDNFHTLKDILSTLDDGTRGKYPQYLKQAGCRNWHEALDTLLVAERSEEIRDVRIKEAQDRLSDAVEAAMREKDIISSLKKTKQSIIDAGKESEMADKIARLNQSITEHYHGLAEASTKIPDLQKGVEQAKAYKTAVSMPDAERIINNAPDELRKAAKSVYTYNNTVLAIMYKSGMVSKAVYKALTEKYKKYVPMMRDFSDEAGIIEGFGMGGKSFANVAKAIKSLSDTGSTRQVKSPLESMVDNTYKLLSMAERNKVGQKFAAWSKTPGAGKLCEEVVGTAKQKDSTVSVWFNGKKHTYATTPEIYQAITNMNQASADTIIKMLSVPASTLRAGATLMPDFALKNILRDSFGAAVFSRYGFRPVVDHVAGIFHMVKQDQLFHDYKASGALMSTMVGLDRDLVQASLKGLYKKDGTYYWNKYNPVQILRGFSELLESATRQGEYGRAISKGATMDDAALSARDVSLDFSKAGKSGRQLNKIAAFFNAGVQEPARIFQAFKEDPKGTALKTAMYITMPSVVLWTMNHNQEWYKELPLWQKNIFWCFKAGDTIYRIPKPFGLGVIFGSLPERTLDWVEDKNPNAMKSWLATAGDNLVPNVAPTAIMPIIEWIANYSFFRNRSIVPQRENILKPEDQYGSNTSMMARDIGKMFGLSPRKVDSLFQGYGGGMATQALNTWDYAHGNRDMDNPLKKAFTVDVTRSPQSVQDFYDAMKDSEEAYNSAKLHKTMDKETAFNYKLMQSVNNGMTKFNKAERKALEEHNQAEVDRISALRMKLAESAMRKYRRKD